MTVELDKLRDDLDEKIETITRAIITACKDSGLSLEETKRQVLDNPDRAFFLDMRVSCELYSINPSFIIKEGSADGRPDQS